jgi:hypothetical protein
MPRHRVVRIGDDAEVREHILHVRRFDEAEAAALHEWDVPPAERDLEVERVEARPEEHRDLRERHAFLAKLEDALRDEVGLLGLVARLDERRPLAVAAHGEEILRVLLRRTVDDRVREVEDRLRRAVVLVERDDPRPGKQLRELHDVPHVAPRNA